MFRWLPVFVLVSPCALAQNQVGLIYGTESGALRRVVAPDDDKQLLEPWVYGKGESLIIVEEKELKATGYDPYLLLFSKTGLDPMPKRAAVLGKDNRVEDFVMADPKIDTLEGKGLADAWDAVKLGYAYDAGRDLYVAPEITVTSMIDDVAVEVRVEEHTVSRPKK